MVDPKIIETVTNNWKMVKMIPDYDMVAGIILFKKIFEIAPEAKALFKFTEGYDIASEDFYASDGLKNHSTKVIRTVDAAVGLLNSDLDKLIEVLQGLGKSHKGYGVIPAHYEVVGQALIATLAKASGDKWSDEVKDAWVAVYTVIQNTMIEAAEY